MDYNEIFHRNEFGAIDSNDDKGRNMITILQLYRPIHCIEWIYEELFMRIEIIDNILKDEKHELRKVELIKLKNIISDKYIRYQRILNKNYNNNSFKYSELPNEYRQLIPIS